MAAWGCRLGRCRCVGGACTGNRLLFFCASVAAGFLVHLVLRHRAHIIVAGGDCAPTSPAVYLYRSSPNPPAAVFPLTDWPRLTSVYVWLHLLLAPHRNFLVVRPGSSMPAMPLLVLREWKY